MSYERISLSLISACSALLGAAIGAWAVTWTEKRKYKQIYKGKILSLLEEALANYTLCVRYALISGKMEIDMLRAFENKILEFQDKHPLLPIQIRVIDKKLYNFLNDIYSFHLKTSISGLKKEERQKIAKELNSKIEKCVQRIYEIWTE